MSVTSLTLLPPILESSAFVLGMRHHQRDQNRLATTRLHGANDGQNVYFDYIEPATIAAIDREAREDNASRSKQHQVSTTRENPVTERASPTQEDGKEFDFIEAATRAAVERNNSESRDEKFETNNEEEESFFHVYPLLSNKYSGVGTKPSTRR